MTASIPILGIALDAPAEEIGRWLTSAERKRKRRYKRALRKNGATRREARQAGREYKKHLKATASKRDGKFMERVERQMHGKPKGSVRAEEEDELLLDEEGPQPGQQDEGADIPLLRRYGRRRPWRRGMTYPPSYRALRAPAENGRGSWIESRRDGRVGPYPQAEIVTLDQEIIIPAIQGQAEEDAVYIRGVVEQVLAGASEDAEFAGEDDGSDGSAVALATIEAVGYDWLDDIAAMSSSPREFELAGAPVIQAMNVVAGEVRGMTAGAEFGAVGLLSAMGGGLASLASKFRSKRRREGKLGKFSAKRMEKLQALRDAGQLNKRQQGALKRLQARQAKRAAQAGFLVQRDGLKDQLRQNRQGAREAGQVASMAARNPGAFTPSGTVPMAPGVAPVAHHPATATVHQPAGAMVPTGTTAMVAPAATSPYAHGYGSPAMIGSGNGLIVPRAGHTVTSAQVSPGVYVVAVQPNGVPAGAGFVNAVNGAVQASPHVGGWDAVGGVARKVPAKAQRGRHKKRCGCKRFRHPVR